MQCKGLLTSAIAALFVVAGLGVAPAGANLDANAVGAAVALPFVTTPGNICARAASPCESVKEGQFGGGKTYISLTNAGSQAINVHGRIIEGNSLDGRYREWGSHHGRNGLRDPDGNWGIVNFTCPMTPKETIFFEVQYVGRGSAKFKAIGGFACPDFGGNAFFSTVNTSGGMVFFSVELAGGLTAENVLFADWAVVDLENGLAFGAEGIAFQAQVGREPTNPNVFDFDSMDLSSFSGAIATNFLLPQERSIFCDLLDETQCGAMILFTLDGTVGVPPNVPFGVVWYDQFERPHSSAGLSFDCWTFRYFHEIDRNTVIPASYPGSYVGHMVLTPLSTVNRPFHGWVVQRDLDGGTTWARVMTESNTNGADAKFTTN